MLSAGQLPFLIAAPAPPPHFQVGQKTLPLDVVNWGNMRLCWPILYKQIEIQSWSCAPKIQHIFMLLGKDEA